MPPVIKRTVIATLVLIVTADIFQIPKVPISVFHVTQIIRAYIPVRRVILLQHHGVPVLEMQTHVICRRVKHFMTNVAHLRTAVIVYTLPAVRRVVRPSGVLCCFSDSVPRHVRGIFFLESGRKIPFAVRRGGIRRMAG